MRPSQDVAPPAGIANPVDADKLKSIVETTLRNFDATCRQMPGGRGRDAKLEA